MSISTFFFRLNTIVVATAFFSTICGVFPYEADARKAEGRTRTSVNRTGKSYNTRDVNRNKNINRNRNVNVNKNVNVNVKSDRRYYDDRHHYHYNRHYDHRHDVGTALVVGAVTGLVVGSIITAASMPPSCTTVVTNGITYRQCGNTWYQPHYAGSQVNYIVVNPPY